MRRLAGWQGEHVRPKCAGRGAVAVVAATRSRPQQCGVLAYLAGNGGDGGKQGRKQARRREARRQVRLGGWQADRRVDYPTTPQPVLSGHSVSTSAAAVGRAQSTQGGAQACTPSSLVSADGAGGDGATVTAAVTQTATGPPASPLLFPPPPPPTPITSTALRSSSNPLPPPSATHLSPTSFPSGGRKFGGQRRVRGGKGNDAGEQQQMVSVKDSA